jgi:hypothetical protein
MTTSHIPSPVKKTPTASRLDAPYGTVSQLSKALEMSDQNIAIQKKYFKNVGLKRVLVAIMPTP